MKKILVSLAAASIVATAGMADVDFKTSGQTVIYYQTVGNNANGTDKDADLFSSDNVQKTGGDKTSANFGVQLNFDADLKNDFTFGSQISYLGTLGLEKNVVNGTMQGTTTTNSNDAMTNTGDDATVNNSDAFALTKLYIAKKVGNTTLKLGRQELPKSLSPLAFSEGWNVFKNTFDASLLVNTDVKDTVIVGAYVSKVNNVSSDLATFDDLGGGLVHDAAYMLTVQNKSLPMTTVTATYYALGNVGTAKDSANNPSNEGVNAYWADVAIADKSLPMGLKAGLQAGRISPENNAWNDTNAIGVKVSATPMKDLTLGAAYTSVDNGTLAIQNLGGVKTPLYTQMVANQNEISKTNNTYMLKAAYNISDMGTAVVSYANTYDSQLTATANDYAELDVAYKFKAAGVDFLTAYVNQNWDHKANDKADHQDIIRVVARYNF